MAKEDLIIAIYRKLWLSADFESDFEAELPETFEKFQIGDIWGFTWIDLNKLYNMSIKY